MKKEKSVTSKAGEVPGRLTHARAAAAAASTESGQLPPLEGVAQENQKQANSKRAVSDDPCPPRKKRPVLQDATNICHDENTTKVQAKKRKLNVSKEANPAQLNVSKEAPSVAQDSKRDSLPEMGIRLAEAMCSVNLEDNAHLRPIANTAANNNLVDSQTSGNDGIAAQPLIPQNKDPDPDVVNIDADFEDPQICSHYAVAIYDNFRIVELSRRPLSNFMETVQHQVNPSMRKILVDWLVEVSEQYTLVPDTLYLTVYLIDQFLSTNNIERNRFQLLGITCMLIASKFEEMNAPHIKDFCYVTDNSYTKQEVLKMETQVLKSCGYLIFAPTTKTFLRRFLRAAQASYTRPSIDLQYLANYLAELSLMSYRFLEFVPSMIAASAVFLARWTLNSSSHPWNPTLEHYASYRASDLRTSILALQELQLNRNNCDLSAIRTKYSQDRFNHVAVLRSPEVLESLFRR